MLGNHIHHTAASFDYHPYGSLHVSVCHPFFFFLISAESRLFLSLPCPHSPRVAVPSPRTLLHRVAGNEVSQPAKGSIFNRYLYSVTSVQRLQVCGEQCLMHSCINIQCAHIPPGKQFLMHTNCMSLPTTSLNLTWG